MIDYSCPSCGQPYTAPEPSAGVKHDCTQCGQRLQVPQVPRAATTAHPPLNKTRLGRMAASDKTMLGKEDPDIPMDVVAAEPKRKRKRKKKREADNRCPECGGYLYEKTSISDTGWIVGILLFFVFFPLAILALFLRETWLVCEECGEKVRKLKSFTG